MTPQRLRQISKKRLPIFSEPATSIMQGQELFAGQNVRQACAQSNHGIRMGLGADRGLKLHAARWHSATPSAAWKRRDGGWREWMPSFWYLAATVVKASRSTWEHLFRTHVCKVCGVKQLQERSEPQACEAQTLLRGTKFGRHV